jgi:hypothetical protein
MSRIILACLLILASAGADALDSRKSGDARRVAGPDEAVQRAVSRINERYQGRVLSAKPVDGGPRVRVKFLTKDGVIRIIMVDPGED